MRRKHNRAGNRSLFNNIIISGRAKTCILFVMLLLIVGSMTYFAAGAEQVEASENLMARSFGMGGAFTAIADDGSALFYNPAGLYDGGSLEVSAGGGVMVGGIFDYFELMALTEEFGEGADDPENIIETLEDIPDLDARGQLLGGGRISQFGFAADLTGELEGSVEEDGNEWEQKGKLNYEGLLRGKAGLAGEITEVPLNMGFLAIGGALGINRVEMGEYNVETHSPPDRPQMTEWRGSDVGISADAGLMAQVTPIVKAGVMVENLIAQDLKAEGDEVFYNYNGEWTEDEDKTEEVQEERSLPRKTRVGVAVDLPVFGTAAADISNVPILSSGDAPDAALHAGVESDLLLGLISVRGGFYRNLNGDGFGMITGGGGLNFGLGNVNLGAGFSPGEGTSSLLVSATLGF